MTPNFTRTKMLKDLNKPALIYPQTVKKQLYAKEVFNRQMLRKESL